MSKRGKGRKPGWEDLRAQIEDGSDPAGYYLLHGAEEFGRNRAVRWLFERLAPTAAREFNVETFHADSLEVERLLDAYRAYPVMADRRVLTLKGCERLSADQCRALEPIVSDPVDSTIVIATGEKVDARRRLFKQMAALGQGVEFPALYDNEVPAWINRHCREERGSPSNPKGRMYCESMSVPTLANSPVKSRNSLCTWARGSPSPEILLSPWPAVPEKPVSLGLPTRLLLVTERRPLPSCRHF